MEVQSVIEIATKHAENGAAMQSSAVLCLQDARGCWKAGDFESAKRRAVKSLAYSVGVFHPDYQAASAVEIN